MYKSRTYLTIPHYSQSHPNTPKERTSASTKQIIPAQLEQPSTQPAPQGFSHKSLKLSCASAALSTLLFFLTSPAKSLASPLTIDLFGSTAAGPSCAGGGDRLRGDNCGSSVGEPCGGGGQLLSQEDGRMVGEDGGVGRAVENKGPRPVGLVGMEIDGVVGAVGGLSMAVPSGGVVRAERGRRRRPATGACLGMVRPAMGVHAGVPTPGSVTRRVVGRG
mmetsp:Transcript_21610/g.52738  ORF Transcript_21610/g.52738 Transcript_21610/m.52738 type:complete len:219 (-) Transcript_21610:111-767(-)